MNAPILLCGLGRVGWRVLEYLQAAGLPVVAIDRNCAPDDPRLEGAKLIKADFRRPEVLEQAGIRTARGVLILTSIDLVNVTTALVIRSLNPEVRVVLRVFNENLIGRLGAAIHNIFVLSTANLVAPLLAVKALTGQALGTFRVEPAVNANEAVYGGERQQVSELTVAATSHLRGQVLAQLIHKYQVQVAVHTPAGGAERFLTEVDAHARVQAGDYLCLCGEPADLARLLSEGRPENAAPRWSSWMRRTGRTAWRTLREMDLAVKITTAVLLIVVFGSSLLFLIWKKGTLGDALYRTISVMATAADMRGDTDTEEAKVFASVLRIVGMALMAIFTAIVTNSLLRASLSGALEVRRIPDGGHVIVCGLGNIGFRTVEALVDSGERVVAIEVSRENRFLSTVRRQGVPVIVGDASITEVMRQAHAAEARAVIACTSNDMVNLEVSLLARELNPTERVVVLQSDPGMAELLRAAANVRLAVSVPNLAAPAFVAALFGDRVLSVFLVEDRLLAVIDLLVQEQDTHLVGQSARTVAVDHRLLPVCVVPADGSPPPRYPQNACLGAGDRLVAIIELRDLEKLLRRQPATPEWAVDVTGCELSSREWLQLFVQTSRQVTEEEAGELLERMPFCLESRLTRGQALDLVALLERERVEASMRRDGAA